MKEKHNNIAFCREAPKVDEPSVMKKPAIFNDFLKFANFFYTTIGIQPYKELGVSKARTLLLKLIFLFGVVNLNVMMLGEIIFVVMAIVNRNNFMKAVTTMSYIGFVMVGNTKMIFIWIQKPNLTRFVNGLKDLFPDNEPLQVCYNIEVYLRECNRITTSFSILYMVLIWTYNLMDIVRYLVCDRWLGMPDIEQAVPYIMYTPWDWHDHWSYYVLYGFHIVAGYTSAAGQIASDLLLVSCATQLVMHFDYISQEISRFQYDDGLMERGSAGAVTKKRAMDYLKNIACYHAKLLDLSHQMNEIFGVPLLLNFISSSCVICFVGFQITIGASPEMMVKLFLFIISSAAQVYLICHYGQLLIDASTNVAYAAYNQEWVYTDVLYQKMLIIIAQRAQKPAQLKATIFVRVSRRTMSEIMQISYKFFALLRTMYSN